MAVGVSEMEMPTFYLIFLPNRLSIEIILLYLHCQTRTNNNPLTTNEKPSITQERAVVECVVVRKRYSKSCRNPIKAGKTVYKIYHNDDLVKELDHEPKPMDLINACAYNVNWTIIE